MLEEYAITPDVFDPSAYSNTAFIEMCLPHLKESLLQDALVRDLCAGGWSQFCLANSSGMHRRCKEILRKLSQNNRLRRFPQKLNQAPVSSADWCAEGLATSASDPVAGVIASHVTKQQFAQGEVASIEKLTGTPWWQRRSSTVSVDRKTIDYQRVLHRVFSQSNSLMFIDPNLDPSQSNYLEFNMLLAPLEHRELKPRIEVHRSFCKGDGKARTFPTIGDWKTSFSSFDHALKVQGLSAEVFFWDDFHIRLLITDLIGIQLESGFDVTKKRLDETLWSRLGRADKDDWQKKFDPAARAPKWRFKIGV